MSCTTPLTAPSRATAATSAASASPRDSAATSVTLTAVSSASPAASAGAARAGLGAIKGSAWTRTSRRRSTSSGPSAWSGGSGPSSPSPSCASPPRRLPPSRSRTTRAPSSTRHARLDRTSRTVRTQMITHPRRRATGVQAQPPGVPPRRGLPRGLLRRLGGVRRPPLPLLLGAPPARPRPAKRPRTRSDRLTPRSRRTPPSQIVGRRLAFTVRNQLFKAALVQDIAFFDRRGAWAVVGRGTRAVFVLP